MNFKDLKISDELIDTLKKNGIKTPTPIQEESILHIKNNKDTGKSGIFFCAEKTYFMKERHPKIVKTKQV